MAVRGSGFEREDRNGAGSTAAGRVVVVTKDVTYRDLVVARRQDALRRIVAGSRHGWEKQQQVHRTHEQTVERVIRILERAGVGFDVVGVPHEPFSVSGARRVLPGGGDGTLLGASQRCDKATPIVGVNSDPGRSVGFFCGLERGRALAGAIAKALAGELPSVSLARMQVCINDEVVSRRVLNEALFCHACPAATSRYVIQLEDRAVQHKSSGFWIGPAAGSTAAQFSAGGKVLPLASRKLQLVVREPYAMTGPVELAKALIAPGQTLTVYNLMREAKLFLDGPHSVFDVGAGAKLSFRISTEPLRVLALPGRRGRGGDRAKPPGAEEQACG